jgi:hypothetical protein
MWKMIMKWIVDGSSMKPPFLLCQNKLECFSLGSFICEEGFGHMVHFFED